MFIFGCIITISLFIEFINKSFNLKYGNNVDYNILVNIVILRLLSHKSFKHADIELSALRKMYYFLPKFI